ncbi:PH domain-containing protein [Actinoplanes sp. DH11]|uniref:PH domain-containing protein n=1 Tax=Actinoplanes sp. DH11 TaxID=2857011 RepID=UPI001E5D75FA|nr:PH domain-containing protein [Actinoplanes sp. DH11]
MAFPEDVLADEEEVVLHLAPHWRAAIVPLAVLLPAVAGLIMAWVLLPDTEGGRIGFWLAAAILVWYSLRYGVWPLVVWRCTHYVVTNERILLQRGVLTRERRDLPLNRVNDHALAQSVLDRVFGSGTLTVDSIGDRTAVLTGLPHAQRVQSTLYELIELSPAPDDDEADADPGPDEETAPAPRRGVFRR